MVNVASLGSKGLKLKFYENTSGICQEVHLEFKVLHWSSKKSDSKASVEWQTYRESARLSLRNMGEIT